MPEQICYEFNGFRLDPVRHILHHNGEPRPMTPTSFALLLFLVQNHGKTLERVHLIGRVWPDTFVTDNNFNVNLNAVRRALGESARQPRYIFKVSGGYSFVAEVRETRTTPIDQPSTEHTAEPVLTSPALSWQVGIASVIYALLYSVALVLEIAYQFDRFGGSAFKIATLVFGWITISSVAGLAVDQKLTSQNRAGGLIASAGIFLIAAAALFAFLTRYLPAYPITQSNLQSYPAQAAYLKDTLYFLGLVFCFLIVPFHFIVSAERDIKRSQCDQLLDLLSGNKLSVSLKGAIYPRL